MASIAEQLIGGAQKTAESAGEGLQQLSKNIQATQQQRAKLESQKQALQLKKINRFATAVSSGSRLKDKSAQNSYFNNFLPKLRSGLGLDDTFNDDSLKMIGSSPDLQAKFAVMQSKVQRGTMSIEEAIATVNDPEKLAQLSTDSLIEAEQFAIDQTTKGKQFEAKRDEKLISARVKKEEFVAKETSKLRKELRGDKVTQRTLKVNDAFETIRTSLAKNTAAGDLAGIFAFMKAQDPESTVREGEFANAQNAAGIPDRVRNLWNRGIKGTRLGSEQRKEFLDIAESLAGNQNKRQAKVNTRFKELATKSGLDPESVIIGTGAPQAQKPIRLGKVTRANYDSFDEATKKRFLQKSNAPNEAALFKAFEEGVK